MEMNGGFLVTKIKQLGDRIFEKILSEKNIDAFNGAQGRILYVLWQKDGISIRSLSTKCGFVRSHNIPNFFTDNYDHPIYECGVQLIDMVYLQRYL